MNWLNKHSKHILLLSSAGKLIFSLHDDFEDGLSLCSLLCAIAGKTNNKVTQFNGGGHTILFKYKGDLLLVACISQKLSNETIPALLNQLELLYHHVLFHVTEPALHSLFSHNSSYDLSILLGGTDIACRHLLEYSTNELPLVLDAIPVVPLPHSVRLGLTIALEAARADCATFAFLLMNIKGKPMLLCGLGPRTNAKQQSKFCGVANVLDFILLSHFVLRQSDVMETWTPLCLPQFNSSGHFHCYSSSILASEVYFVLFTTNPSLEHFHFTSERRKHFTMSSAWQAFVGSSRVDLQACKLEYSIVSPK